MRADYHPVLAALIGAAITLFAGLAAVYKAGRLTMLILYGVFVLLPIAAVRRHLSTRALLKGARTPSRKAIA